MREFGFVEYVTNRAIRQGRMSNNHQQTVAEPISNARSDWSQPTKYERWYASSLGRVYAASLERVLLPWFSKLAGSLGLDLYNTEVTDAGDEMLQNAFPNCEILR